MSNAITRKEIIEDEALKWGEEYGKIMDSAISKNKEFVSSIIQLSVETAKLKRTENRTDYLKQSQENRLATEKLILSLKEQQAEEIKLEKVKQEGLKTEKLELDVINKKATAQKRSTQLTIEERVQNEINNKLLKQAAREQLGLVGAYEKLNTARTNAQKKLADLLAAEVKNKAAIKAAQKEYDTLNTKIQKVDKATDIYTKNIGNYKSAVNGLGGMLTNLLGAFGIVGGISFFVGAAKNVFDVTKELQSLDMALKQVTGTQENFADQQSFLKRISEQYGVELKSLTKTYTQFYVAAKDKLAGSEIQKIFESVTKAGATMGLSVESQERAFLALNQMMSKGTIQAEELRGQLGEALPGAFGIMAKALGVNEKQLGKMMKDGKLLAQDVLPKFAAQLEKTYGIENVKNVDNLTASQNRLSNAWTAFVRSLDEDGNKMTKVLKGIYNLMTDTVDGWRGIFTSSETERKNYLQSLRNDAKKYAIEYYTSDEKLSDENLKKKKENLRAEAEAISKNVENMINVNKAIKLPGFNKGIYSSAQEESYKLWLKNNAAINKNKETLSQYYGTIEGINDLLFKNTKKPVVGETDEERKKRIDSDEERKKRIDSEKKAMSEYLKLLKKRNDNENELNQFRLEREIYYNQLIVDDDKKSIEERINASLQIEQLQKALSDNSLKYQLKNSALSEDNFKNMSDYQLTHFRDIIDQSIKSSEIEAQNLINTGQLKKNASAEEIIAYEKYQLELKKIDDKRNENQEKLVNSQVAIIQKGIEKQLLLKDTELNNSIEKENEVYAAQILAAQGNQEAIEEAEKQHQNRLFEIKKKAAKEALQIQIDAYQSILDSQNKLPENERISADEIIKIQNKLSKFRAEANEVDYNNTDGTNKKKVLSEEEMVSMIKEKQKELKDDLLGFANALFEAKISKIDDEIQATDAYYAQQIELAGNDSALKDKLTKEQAKKDDELNKKKRKAAHDQAVFNKITALSEVAIRTSLAVMDVLSTGGGAHYLDFGATAGVLSAWIVATGLAQAATILATPIPKYKDGRKGGPAELAIVGDGGRSEVVTDKFGNNPYLTPAKPTFTYLKEDAIVHKSVEDYQKHVHASLINDFDKNVESVRHYQIAINAMGGSFNRDILEELNRNTRAVERNKGKSIIQNKIDFGYEIRRMRNINWNR